MTADALRASVREKLRRNHNRVLLRILLAADNSHPVELTGAEILEKAEEMAARYAGESAARVVLLLLPHSPELFLLHLGLMLRGKVPAILAWPTSRVDAAKYQGNLLHQLCSLPAGRLITLPTLAGNLAPWLPFPVMGCPVAGMEELEKNFRAQFSPERQLSGEKRFDIAGPRPVLPDDALFLQFSGGTTGAQKCVVVTAAILDAQLRRLSEALGFSREDGVVSWLPLYHDMGLIACFWLPLWSEAPSFQFAAGDWLLKPGLLFHFLERYRATFCWLPNFAFSYMAVQRPRMAPSYSLKHVRAWINCSEPVRLLSITQFADCFADWGVTSQAIHACYAMAENVFAVTQTDLHSGWKTFSRSLILSRSSNMENPAFNFADQVYVSSGRALVGMRVRIRDEAGAICEDARPGNIELLTECLFSGYWGNEGYIKHSILEGGWYSTGDYGFAVGQDLFVIGRMKDIVIVGGQNIYPEDVETLVSSIPGAYPGRAVAFGIADEQFGTEGLAVVAEMKGPFVPSTALDLERQIQSAILAAIGIAPRYVKIYPERWIIKSTAGKISRKETKARFLQERAGDIARSTATGI